MATENIGIDLGTTNTVIHKFTYNPGMDLQFDPIPISIAYPYNHGYPILARSTLPSIILMVEDREHPGKYTRLVGEVAMQMLDERPEYAGKLLWNTKRLMGHDEDFVDAEFTAEKAAEEFLKVCFYSVQKHRTRPFHHFCVTRPAAFDPYNIYATHKAVELARKAVLTSVTNLEEFSIDLLEEPQAALLSFLYDRIKDEELEEELLQKQKRRGGALRIAVVDIGGGTTDVIVQNLRITGKHGEHTPYGYVAGNNGYFTDYTITFLNKRDKNSRGSATNPHQDFGGLDFDEEAARHIIAKLKDECLNQGIFYDALSEDERTLLKNLATMNAQEFKESSLRFNELRVPVSVLGTSKSVRVTYSRDEYNEWVAPLCGGSGIPQRKEPYGKDAPTVYSLIQKTMNVSGYGISDLDYIYVTGGMSKCKPVNDMIRREFSGQANIEFSPRPLDDISRGAALYNTFFRVDRDVYTLPESIMMDVPLGEPIILAEKNSPLPTPRTPVKGFRILNPLEFTVQVLRGSGPLSPDLKRIKTQKIDLGRLTAVGTEVIVYCEVSKDEEIDMEIEIKDKKSTYRVKMGMDA